MPSIQPQHSATSSASAAVTVGTPEAFLKIFSHTSGSRSWLRRSHDSNAASVRNALIRLGLGTTAAIHPPRLKNCTARSCFTAADRDVNVPRFRRFPVLGLRLRE